MEATIILDPSELEHLAERSAENAANKLLERNNRTTDGKNGEFFTNNAAMNYLGLSRATLQRYRDDGRLPFSKIGRNIFYRRADVEALLEAGMRTPRHTRGEQNG